MLTEERRDADALEQLPNSLRQQLTFERFHLHKPEVFQNRSRDPAFDPKYFPQHCGVMQLPCYWIQRRHLYVFGAQRAGDELGFFAGDGPDGEVLFPMHPASAANYRELLIKLAARDAAKDGLCIWAVPTSSTRTLLAWPDRIPERAVFVKTSLHSKIFGDRRLHAWKVARSVALSGLVQETLHDLPRTLRYFPEGFGMVPRQMTDSGVIVRSIPREIKTSEVLVAPLFALMGGEHAQPLFLRLMQQSDRRPMDFVERVLCEQFARLWLETTLRHGLILESHWQDLMLAISPDGHALERFYYRDFEGLQVDWELRRQLGLTTPAYMPHSYSWRETYGGWQTRYGGLVCHKQRNSLLLYLHSVLSELEQMLHTWQQQGLLGGPRVKEGDLTAIFSRHVLDLIRELFAIRVQIDYDIHRHLNRFLLLLLSVRKRILASAAICT
jgi:hypothetical protein